MAKIRGKIPVFGIILLIVGALWILQDLAVIPVDLPWIPIVVILVAVAIILKRLNE